MFSKTKGQVEILLNRRQDKDVTARSKVNLKILLKSLKLLT